VLTVGDATNPAMTFDAPRNPLTDVQGQVVHAVNVPHKDAPSHILVKHTGQVYQPDYAVSLRTTQLKGHAHFAVAGCSCLSKPVCPCRPEGNLINPAPEYITPKMKKMVNAKLREHVKPRLKRPVTGFVVNKKHKCCGPTGRRCRRCKKVCGCRKLVFAEVMTAAQCPCAGHSSVAIDAPSTLVGNVAVVGGNVVRSDIITPNH